MSSSSNDPSNSKRLRALNKAYKYTSSWADKNVGTNRGLAAGTAASVIGMGIDRTERRDSRDSLDTDIFSDEELNALKDMEEPKDSKTSHFMDHFVEKLLKNTMPDDDKQIIEERLHDPERTKRPGLSLKIIASNFKKLSTKMSGFFEIQYGLIHIVTWKRPTKTLSFLVMYTAICLWPHLVLALPLLFLLFGIMIPAYIHRHPMKTPELIKVKKRGQSIFEFFNQSLEDSILIDLLSDEFKEHELRPTSSISSESSTSVFTQQPVSANSVASDPVDVNEKLTKRRRARYVKSQMSLFLNMRDLQNLTSDVIVAFDQAETFWFETAGFKDERFSTFLFYIVAIATYIVLFLGRFIPWRLIFIQSGWLSIILCHPHSKKLLVAILKNKQKQKLQKQKKEEDSGSPKEDEEPKKFDRHDIIIDDAADVRVVEIYVLEVKSLTKNEWSFYCYSNRLFNCRDHLRLSGKRPTGVEHLSKVLPPPEWKFDVGYENNWGIDIDPSRFLEERQIDSTYLLIKDDEKEGWIYDKLKNADTSDSVYEFRRRRLVRECFRYSRPPKKPLSC